MDYCCDSFLQASMPRVITLINRDDHPFIKRAVYVNLSAAMDDRSINQKSWIAQHRV